MTVSESIVFLRNRLDLSRRVFGDYISRSVAYVCKVTERAELLKTDPSLCKHIRSYIDHLEERL